MVEMSNLFQEAEIKSIVQLCTYPDGSSKLIRNRFIETEDGGIEWMDDGEELITSNTKRGFCTELAELLKRLRALEVREADAEV